MERERESLYREIMMPGFHDGPRGGHWGLELGNLVSSSLLSSFGDDGCSRVSIFSTFVNDASGWHLSFLPAITHDG